MSEMFPTVSKLKRGYDQQEVDDFFEQARKAYEGGMSAEEFSSDQVRLAVFTLRRGGYDIADVDEALARLEAAFVQRDRTAFVSEHGEAAWFEKIADEATVLYPRLLRPKGERFLHPAEGGKGYDASEVDGTLDRLADYFEDREQLTADQMRAVVFKVAKGDQAYDEAQVDAFLGKAVYIMTAVS